MPAGLRGCRIGPTADARQGLPARSGQVCTAPARLSRHARRDPFRPPGPGCRAACRIRVDARAAPAADPAQRLRHRAAARRPAGGHRPRAARRRHPRHHADRRRQVAVLPAAGAAAAGAHGGGLAADRADEGPVRQAARARHRRGADEQRRRCRGGRRRRGGDRRRQRAHRLRHPRTAGRRGFHRAAAHASGQSAGRRRGALHLALGTRLPARRSWRSARRWRRSAGRRCWR